MPRVTVAYCHLGHHSEFIDENLDDFDEQWNILRDLHAERLKDIFNPCPWSPDDFKDYSTAGTLLLGLIVLSDWIASNTDLMPVRHNVTDYYEYVRISMVQAVIAVNKLGFDEQMDWGDHAAFADVWNGFKPRPVQKPVKSLSGKDRCPDLSSSKRRWETVRPRRPYIWQHGICQACH